MYTRYTRSSPFLLSNIAWIEEITGTQTGCRLLPRSDLTPADFTLPFSFRKRQCPIQLAFFITINKAQGQTLDCVGIYPPEPVFSHRQLYAAMSRARSFENGKIQTRNGSKASNV